MKKLLILLILISSFAYGQQSNTTNTKFINGLASGNGTTEPTTGLTAGMLFHNTTLGMRYYNGTAWVTIGISGVGVTTMGAFGSSPNANGGSISGVTLTLQPASASFPGGVTTSGQTFAGAKIFTSSIRQSAGNGTGIIFENTDAANKAWTLVKTGNDMRMDETGVGNRTTWQAGGNVGFGTVTPINRLSVQPYQYGSGSGTASQSGTTITGSGTVFTSLMVGSQFVFEDGTNAGTITAYSSGTSLTVSTSQTVASQVYSISYTGLQVTSTGLVGIGTPAPATIFDVGYAGYKQGSVRMAGLTSGNVTVTPNAVAGTNITQTLQAASGTIALTSDLTGGTVTSVATNTGTFITGGTITTTGTLALDTAGLSGKYWRLSGQSKLTANTYINGMGRHTTLDSGRISIAGRLTTILGQQYWQDTLLLGGGQSLKQNGTFAGHIQNFGTWSNYGVIRSPNGTNDSARVEMTGNTLYFYNTSGAPNRKLSVLGFGTANLATLERSTFIFGLDVSSSAGNKYPYFTLHQGAGFGTGSFDGDIWAISPRNTSGANAMVWGSTISRDSTANTAFKYDFQNDHNYGMHIFNGGPYGTTNFKGAFQGSVNSATGDSTVYGYRANNALAGKWDVLQYDVNGVYKFALRHNPSGTQANSMSIHNMTTGKDMILFNGRSTTIRDTVKLTGLIPITTVSGDSIVMIKSNAIEKLPGTYYATSSGLGAYLPLAGGTMVGNIIATDNTYDIGASGATRFRTGYFATSLISPLFNGLAITNNGTNTLAIAAGKTLTASNTLTFTGTDASSVAFGTGGTVLYALTGAMLLATANTVTTAGAVSAPSQLYTGAIYAAGTTTTSHPYMYFNSGASAPSTFSAVGTVIGVNAQSGFAGNFLDFHVNGAAATAYLTAAGELVNVKITSGIINGSAITGTSINGVASANTSQVLGAFRNATVGTAARAGVYIGNDGSSTALAIIVNSTTFTGANKTSSIIATQAASTLTLGASNTVDLTLSGTGVTFAATSFTMGTIVVTAPAASGTIATIAGTETLTNKTLTTPNIGAATGSNLNLTTGGTSHIILGQNSVATTYNLISLNGIDTDVGKLGLTGGGGTDKNLYIDVPATGTFPFRVATATVASISATGVINSTALTASQLVQTDGSKNLVSSNTLPASVALTTPAFTGVPTGTITASTYTPTITNGTNVDSSTPAKGQYTRVGNVVTVFGSVTIDATLISTQTDINITLPIASNIAAAADLNGLAVTRTGVAGGEGQIIGDATNDQATFSVFAPSASSTIYYYSFSYEVL